MLFQLQIQVNIPPGTDTELLADLFEQEKAISVRLQRNGTIVQMWRHAGRRAMTAIWDVRSHEELHELLSGLPMFSYLDVDVTPLARHPNWLGD